MMRTLRCRRRVALPLPVDGEDLVALNASVDGALVAVSALSDRRGGPRVRVHLHGEADGWRQVPLEGVTITPSHVDLLPGTGFLLARSRSITRPFEVARDNAQVFDVAGRALRSFRLGDGIAHLGVDGPGTIWVGYFDEGVYGGDPLSAAGLARFDEYGRRLWSYRPPPGLDHITDCYALNVGTRTTWAYYYTGFPLVEITDTRVRAFRLGPVRGVAAVLINGNEVAFVGADSAARAEWRLRGGDVVPHGPIALTDPDGRPVRTFRVVSARGSRLFVRTAGHVLEADLADAV